MRTWATATLLGALAVCGPPSTRAGEIDTAKLMQIIQQQGKQIRALTKRVGTLEAQQVATRAAIGDEIRKAEALGKRVDAFTVARVPDLPSWVKKVRWSGDFRYRHEFFDIEARDRERHRHRIRARLAMDADASDELSLHFRLATGSDDPVSTNQTLEGSFASKHIWLDRAYFDWHPDAVPGFHLQGGKTPNPFLRVGGSQLIWDSDLNFEGLQVKYSTHPSETTKLFAAGGGFWVEEESGSADNLLYGVQAGIEHDFGDGVRLTLGGGYYDYTNVQGTEVFYDSEDSFGNTAVPVEKGSADLGYVEDFRLWEAFAELRARLGDIPVSVFGHYVNNAAADSGKDTGWMVGGSLGKAKKPGSWQLTYNYRDLEADAVVGAFCDSDFIGGGTDGRGHTFGAVHQLSRRARAAVTYFFNEYGPDSEDYRRLQLDFIVKF